MNDTIELNNTYKTINFMFFCNIIVCIILFLGTRQDLIYIILQLKRQTNSIYEIEDRLVRLRPELNYESDDDSNEELTQQFSQ